MPSACSALRIAFESQLRTGKFARKLYVVSSRVIRRAHRSHRVSVLNGLVGNADHTNVAEGGGSMN